MESFEIDNIFELILSIIPLITIFFGTISNTISLLIFRLTKQFKNLPSMIYLSFVAFFDTLSLFQWNLNHFTEPNFGIRLESLNLFSCKFIIFIQLFSMHSSALLLSFMCIDRFISIKSTPGSIYSRLPFSTLKSSLFWSLTIIITMFLFNFHILIFNGNFIQVFEQNFTSIKAFNSSLKNYTINLKIEERCYWYAPNFKIYPAIDLINLVMYNFIPFTIMIIFNFLLIKSILPIKYFKDSFNQSSINRRRRKTRITILTLTVTFAFLLMTTPASISYGFFTEKFQKTKHMVTLFRLLDNLAFLFHSTLFFNCYITNSKFRKYCLNFFIFIKKFFSKKCIL